MDAAQKLEEALKANIQRIAKDIAKSADEVLFANKRLENDHRRLADAQKELADFYAKNMEKAA